MEVPGELLTVASKLRQDVHLATEAGAEDDAQQPQTRRAWRDQLRNLDGTATVNSRPRHTISAQGTSLSLATCTMMAWWFATRRPSETRPHNVRSIRSSKTDPVTDAETFNADSSTGSTWRGDEQCTTRDTWQNRSTRKNIGNRRQERA